MAVGGGECYSYTPTSFSRNIDKVFDEAQLTGELKLSGRKLKDYPKNSFKHDLRDTLLIDLSKNRFGDLPYEVCEYLSLEKLNLHHNAIRSLPDSLCNLQRLSHLILSRNQLSVLPSSICNLTNLRVLDVSGNRLVSLPEDIGALRSLTDLDASHNQLQRLPPSLGDLDDLRRLKLGRNLLQNVPTELCFLHLVCLDLSFNQIACLPTEFRFMSSLFLLLLEANPLSHPPANICMRGRVHIFKWLDQTALKQDKKRLVTEVEFRKSRKFATVPSSSSDFRFVNGFLEGLAKRSTVDSGYSTSENGDHRWSQGSQDFEPLKGGERNREERKRMAGLCNGFSRDSELSSVPSTPSTLSPGESFNLEDEFYKAMKMRPDPMEREDNSVNFQYRMNRETDATDHNCSVSTIENGHLPPHPSPYTSHQSLRSEDSFPSKNPTIPTYREYLETKRQQRVLETSNVYKRADNPATDCSQQRWTQSQSHIPNSANCSFENGTRPHVKDIQKEAVLSYVKARVSPTKSIGRRASNEAIPHHADNHPRNGLPHSQSFTASVNPQALPSGSHHLTCHPRLPNSSAYRLAGPGRETPPKSPAPVPGAFRFEERVGSAPGRDLKKSNGFKKGGGVYFDPSDRLNFTFRRELDKQHHEKVLIENLRNIIETRLKVSLPSDLSSALMDGVVLCHLVNHVRPRTVSSIHVPSPVSPKLTIAKCRLNVENFLEACRRIGVPEAVLCSRDDIVANFDTNRVLATVNALVNDPPPQTTGAEEGTVHANGAGSRALPAKFEPDTAEGGHTNSSPQQRFLSYFLLTVFAATVLCLYYRPVEESSILWR